MVIEKGNTEEQAAKAAPAEGPKLPGKRLLKKPAKPDKKRSLKTHFKKLWRYRFAALGALIACLTIFGLLAWRNDKATMTNDEIVIRVSSELEISGDGNPRILDVTDESKANAAQPFLEGAKNGDVVLLYYKAKKSALFRPSEDKIIRTGTYTPPDAKVFIRKGTTDDTKVILARDRFVNAENTKIVSQDNGVKQDYDKTVVVDLGDRYPAETAEIAKLLGASVARLPGGETIPDADILVIVGSQ